MTKYQTDPAKFLLDTGLLFEINRDILHPLGLALAVQVPGVGDPPTDPKTERMTCFLQVDDDPEGMSFSEEALKDGAAKLGAYLVANPVDPETRRRALGGHIVQPLPIPEK